MSWSSHDRRAAPLVCRLVRAVAQAAQLGGLMAGASAAAQPVARLEVDARALASANPLLLEGSDRDAILLEVTARPGVSLTTPTGSVFDLSAVITDRKYTRRYGNFVLGGVQAIADYRDSERLTIGGFALVERTLAVDLLTGSVEAATDPTSIRTGYAVRGNATWRPNEYTWIVPLIGVEKYNYSRTALLGDTRAITASLAVRRRTDARTRIGVRAGAIFSNTALLDDTTTQALYGTIDRRLNAAWRASGELGVERNSARAERVFGVRVDQSARTLLSGRAELCRDVEDPTTAGPAGAALVAAAPATSGPVICLSGSVNSEVSGLGGLQRRAVVAASYDQDLDERSSVAVVAQYQRAVMQGSVFPDFDAIRTSVTGERALNDKLRLAGTVQYLRRRLINGTRAGAVFAGFRLTYTPRLR